MSNSSADNLTSKDGDPKEPQNEGDPQPDPQSEQLPQPKTPSPNPPKPTFQAKLNNLGRKTYDLLSRLGSWIQEHYCTIDVRTLGLFRWVLGFLLVTDCMRHWADAQWAYSNDGVLTNHYHLFRPSSGFNFSIYHAFSSLGEVHIAFALSLFCFFCFMVGWKTRLFSILAFVLVTSMDSRLVLVENGGYVVVNLIVCWAMFMPLGRRFSVDALLRSYRERQEMSAADLQQRYRPDWMDRPYVSGIVLIAVLNLAAIYFFNVVNKSGQIWRRGETVHYVLHLDRMVTGISVFIREHFPFWSTRLMTWSVLVLEGCLIPWILSPHGHQYTRPLALLGIGILHASFGTMMRLGPFSWFMIGWSMLLLTPLQWDVLERWYRRQAQPRTVIYDRDSPLAFAIARLLLRLDHLSLLSFEQSPEEDEASPPPLIQVQDPNTTKSFVGTAAVREILQALPGGRLVRPFLPLLTLGLLGPLFKSLRRNRQAYARFFGLTLPPRPRKLSSTPSPLSNTLAKIRTIARETLIAYLGLCAVSQSINENKSVPPLLKHTPPRFVQATLQYPRIFQGWGMFAPNPIQDDGIVAIDALTIDGRHIDPFTGHPPDLDLTDARGLGMGQIQQDYFNRIRLDRNKAFRKPGLQDFLLAYHKRTGKPEDEIVAFDVYWVQDMCPKPGQTQPYSNKAIPIMSYRKPNYTPPPGLPPLPKILKEESAGK